MLTGFEKIVEERIKAAQSSGEFNELPGTGKPLPPDDDWLVPEELRMAYRMLKNADCLPPVVELKKEIRTAETLLADMPDTREKYNAMKRLNVLVMKYNTLRGGNICFDVPQAYLPKLTERFEKNKASSSS